MKETITSAYPVGPEVVARMFSDPEFHTGKLEAMGVEQYELIHHKVDGDDVSIKISRKIPMDAPRVVKKVIPAVITAVSEETWNEKALTGRVSTSSGIPVDMNCTATISAKGSGSVVTYQWEIKARVPLIGGALEKFIVADMKRQMAEEARVAATLTGKYA